MGKLSEFEKEKLILGVIYSDEALLLRALELLRREFGEFDLCSEEFSFSKEFSDYYDEELGGEGMRRIYSFERTVDPGRQAQIKTLTNRIEQQLAVNGKRHVNLDPGFLSRGRLMLATTKGAGFRIPLSDSIYTELTLIYDKGGWLSLPWTYRDYKSPLVQKFLSEVRKKYLAQRREELAGEGKIPRASHRSRSEKQTKDEENSKEKETKV